MLAGYRWFPHLQSRVKGVSPAYRIRFSSPTRFGSGFHYYRGKQNSYQDPMFNRNNLLGNFGKLNYCRWSSAEVYGMNPMEQGSYLYGRASIIGMNYLAARLSACSRRAAAGYQEYRIKKSGVSIRCPEPGGILSVSSGCSRHAPGFLPVSICLRDRCQYFAASRGQ